MERIWSCLGLGKSIYHYYNNNGPKSTVHYVTFSLKLTGS